MKTWLINRLKERSTWSGIITVITVAGLTISPEQKEQIITIGTTLIALILTFTADPTPPFPPPPVDEPPVSTIVDMTDADRDQLR